MESLGERLRDAQKLLALDLNDETDQSLSREELAASLVADAVQESGGSSSLAKSTPDESKLHELQKLFENI